jgi:hypothetical protein
MGLPQRNSAASSRAPDAKSGARKKRQIDGIAKRKTDTKQITNHWDATEDSGIVRTEKSSC